MGVGNSAVWRSGPSGNDANGGGYDTSLSSAATGTHGSFSGTTFTDATAAAFTTGMVGASILIVGVGQYLITARIDASNITLGSGAPPQALSGGMQWQVGAGTDYSQQNAAQATGSHGTATGSSTFIDATASAFTSAMVGNCILIASGAGFTAGLYFVTGFTSATTVTLDRSPGTGTVAIWKLGGRWADPFTNTTATNNFIVPGNKIYILGAGIPNPASYSYDYTLAAAVAPVAGSTGNGYITFENDPATPSYKAAPDCTGGMPCISLTTGQMINLNSNAYFKFVGLWLVAASASSSGPFVNTFNTVTFGCVIDQNGFDLEYVGDRDTFSVIGGEIFSYAAPGGGAGSNYAVNMNKGWCIGVNIHDCVGGGITFNNNFGFVEDTVVSNCRFKGVRVNTGGGQNQCVMKGVTVDGNADNGVEVANNDFPTFVMLNCNITNHTGVGKFGFAVDNNSVLTNSFINEFVDYNTYYNNTADLSGVGYGAHDTHGGSNPYVNQPNEDYTLA